MAWIGRAIMAVGAVGRMALGFIGVSLVAVALIPQWKPAVPAPTESIPSTERTATVTLRVPEGEQAGHLTVVDESGRPLAVLTRWRDGSSSIAANRDGGIHMGCHFDLDGTPHCSLLVVSRLTTVDVDPEGRITTEQRAVPPSAPAPGPLPSE